MTLGFTYNISGIRFLFWIIDTYDGFSPDCVIVGIPIISKILFLTDIDK